MGGAAAARYGCIATWENASGERLSFYDQGPPDAVLAQHCDRALDVDPSYRLLARSTPQTIYVDLNGTRGTRTDHNGKTVAVPNSELAALTRVGRRELAHASLTSGHTPHGR